MPNEEEAWKFVSLQLVAGTVSTSEKVRATSTVQLMDAEGNDHTEAAIGAGPVEATFRAINRIIKRCGRP